MNKIEKEITEAFEGYFEHKNTIGTALVLVMGLSKGNEGMSGYGIGIATRHEKGYTPTPFNVYLSDYKQARDIISEVNRNLFNRSDIETHKIVLSTMGGR